MSSSQASAYDIAPDAKAYADMSSFGKSVLTLSGENYLYAPNITNPIAIKGLTGFWSRGKTSYIDIRDGVETIRILFRIFSVSHH